VTNYEKLSHINDLMPISASSLLYW